MKLSRFVLAVLIAAYAACVVRAAWLSDDAYITFRTVENLVAGHGLRWNVAERVQTYTHPLWMLLLSLLFFVTREIHFTVLVASILLSLTAFVLLGWQAWRRGVDTAVVAGGLAALILSRSFVDYSTSGLENALSHLLLVAFAIAFFSHARDGRRLLLLSFIAALAAVNRSDTLLFYLPALALELWRERSWRSAGEIALGFAPLVAWEAFAVLYYGFPFPNPAYAKLRTGIPTFTSWAYGIDYFANSLRWDPITLVVVAAGLTATVIAGNVRSRALATGVILYLAYVVHIGGDFMSGRFFAAPLLAVVAVVLLGIDGALRGGRADRAARREMWLLPAVVVLLGFLGNTPTIVSAFRGDAARGALIDASGIADERGFYYASTGLSGSEAGTVSISRTIARARNAAERHDPLAVRGAVGLFAYHAGPEIYVLDYHALGDPLLSRLPMVSSDPLYREFCIDLLAKPCARPWRIGHFLRNIPEGYVDTLLTGENSIEDAGIRAFYDDVRRITRGPIWSAARWGAIVRMNLGLDDALLGSRQQTAYRPPSFASTVERWPDVASWDVWHGAAREYLNRGQNDKALAAYEKLAALDPSDARVWYELGNVSMRLGRGDEAVERYTRAVTLAPDFVNGHYYRALALERSQRVDDAAAEYREVIRLHPAHYLAHNNLGMMLFSKGELEAAIDEFRRAVEIKPDYANGFFNLGATLLQAGRADEAVIELRECLRLDPSDAGAEEKLRLALSQSKERAASR